RDLQQDVIEVRLSEAEAREVLRFGNREGHEELVGAQIVGLRVTFKRRLDGHTRERQHREFFASQRRIWVENRLRFVPMHYRHELGARGENVVAWTRALAKHLLCVGV